MKVSSIGIGRSFAMVARRRSSRILASGLALAFLGTLVAAGGFSSASQAASYRASNMIPSSAAIVSTTAPKYYLQKSGTGNKVLSSVTLPAKWYLIWRFDCGVKRGNFQLTSTKTGQSSLSVADQTGLGGGGQRPYTKAGTYKFAMKTACSWKVTAASSPPVVANSTTTTTAPKKSKVTAS